MKILIVEDDPISRKMLQNMLSYIGECEAVEDGDMALTVFKNACNTLSPFDIITLDIDMPEMDGKEVLKRIRQIEKERDVPKAKRIKVFMITAHSDKETIIACIEAGCDGYIAKPFDRKIIFEKIEQLGFDIATIIIEKVEKENQAKTSFRQIVLRINKKFKEDVIDLPVLPTVINDIQMVMFGPSSHAGDLSEVIARDNIIPAKLISTVNALSASRAKKVTTGKAAVQHLNFREFQSIVAAIANKNLYETNNKQFTALMERLWVHSIATAYCARAIARELAYENAEKVFFMGLIHDIGKVLLLQAIEEDLRHRGALDMAEILAAIQEVHTSFGEALFRRWGFTEDYIRVARQHENSTFSADTDKKVLMVSLANRMTRRIGCSLFDDDGALEALEPARLLNIGPDAINAIVEETRMIVIDTVDAFFPSCHGI